MINLHLEHEWIWSCPGDRPLGFCEGFQRVLIEGGRPTVNGGGTFPWLGVPYSIKRSGRGGWEEQNANSHQLPDSGHNVISLPHTSATTMPSLTHLLKP